MAWHIGSNLKVDFSDIGWLNVKQNKWYLILDVILNPVTVMCTQILFILLWSKTYDVAKVCF